MVPVFETLKSKVLIECIGSCYTKTSFIVRTKIESEACQWTPQNETNEIINDDSTYPFISYLTDLLAKSKPSDDAVKKLHDCIDKVAVALGHDSTDVFRALLAKLIEEPEEKQTFDRLLEMAEKSAAKHE